jgi:GMP synthase-like glutamine amidotransferase
MDVVEQAVEGSRTAGRDAELMRLRILQHVPFEGPAAIADWGEAHGIEIGITYLYKEEALPALNSFEMLAVMGGPMSVSDEALFPWLAPEIALVRDAIAARKSVLGVCLGAQIIAKALGARVYAGRHKEIGWFPVRRTSGAHSSFDGVSVEFTAFHWHGETFDLPQGAFRLAETAITSNQAFAFGDRVLGLQFHLEATRASVKALIENAADDIGDGPFEQNASTILAGVGHCETIRANLDRVLDNLTRIAREGK